MGQSNQGADLIKGALIGGLLGGAAALLLAPKSGRELREKISDLTENLKETGQKIMHPFREEESCFNGQTPFLVGGSVGAIIGVIAALLPTPQSGTELREALGDKYEEIRDRAEDFIDNVNSKKHQALHQVEDWKDSLITIVNKLSNLKGKKSPFKFDEMLDWANLGLNLLQQLQKRR